MFAPSCGKGAHRRTFAYTELFAADHPIVVSVLVAAGGVPGSTAKHVSERVARRLYKQAVEEKPSSRPWTNMRVLTTTQDFTERKKKQPGLLNHFEDFLSWIGEPAEGPLCPGVW